MSECRGWAWTALVALCASVPVGAQEAPRPQEALRARLDSLLPLLREANARVADEEATREARTAVVEPARVVALDTVRFRALTVVTPAGRAGTVRSVFHDVLDGPLGAMADYDVWRSALIAFEWGSRVMAAEGHVPTFSFDRWTPREEVVDRVRSQLQAMLEAELAPNRPMRAWVSARPIDRGWMGTPAELYRGIALTRSRATRACIDGSTEACVDALGLGGEDGGLLEWYEPEEMIALSTSLRRSFGRAGADRLDPCRAAPVDASTCAEALESLPGDLAPIGPQGRRSLLHFAIEIGGVEGWRRAIAVPDATPTQLLETMSGRPIDALVAQWRADLLTHRAGSHVNLASQGVLALLWALAFAGLSMRSTRWRVR